MGRGSGVEVRLGSPIGVVWCDFWVFDLQRQFLGFRCGLQRRDRFVAGSCGFLGFWVMWVSGFLGFWVMWVCSWISGSCGFVVVKVGACRGDGGGHGFLGLPWGGGVVEGGGVFIMGEGGGLPW